MVEMEPYLPVRKTKSYDLLAEMLQGKAFDLIEAVKVLNVQSINARVSELRRLGWPIDTFKKPHPTLAGEKMVYYGFTKHFLDWYWNTHKGNIDPRHYKAGDDARKSFAPKPSEPLPTRVRKRVVPPKSSKLASAHAP